MEIALYFLAGYGLISLVEHLVQLFRAWRKRCE